MSSDAWSRHNLFNIMTAVSKANPKATEEELFLKISDAMVTHIRPSDAVARLSRDLLIELDTYWSGVSGPSLSGIMLDWRNKYRILLEDGAAAQGSGSRDEIRNAALEEAALYHDKAAADCRAIALCNRDNDLGVDSETHAIDHEIAAKDIREMKT